MSINKNKIIIDTNLWISWLISDKYIKLDYIIKNEKIELLYSKELIEEYLEVICRPKIQKYFKKNIIEMESVIVEIFDKYATEINIKSKVNICRDKKDNFLLSLAIDGKADYLITGDKDLLELEKFKNTNIITLSDFINTNNI
jgi:putative PIN family toxin of toxin-antitoxin system